MKKTRSGTAFTTRIILVLLLSAPLAGCTPIAASSTIPPADLATVIEKNLTGLEIEEAAQGKWTLLRDQAQRFVDFKRGKLVGKAKMNWLASCREKTGQDMFCDYIVSDRSKAAETAVAPDAIGAHAEEDDDRPVPAKWQVVKLLTAGDLKELKRVPENRLMWGMRRIPKWETLQPLSDAAGSALFCPPPAVSYALAQKSEEFLPDEKFRQQAIKHYKRTVSCSSSVELADRARFRLSLLLLWEGNCKDAEEHLQTLSERKGGDFVSRSLYWRNHCARKNNDTVFATAMRLRLINEYPLSSHGLLLRQRGPKEVNDLAVILEKKSDVLRYRSETKPELNILVRAVEVLLELKANRPTIELLEALADRVDGSESSFRLYVAVLMKRAHHLVGQFRVLSQLFREDPKSISRATLEIFYPLDYSDQLQLYKATIDPYLIAALIRQESGFNTKARSPAGAVGLMQLLPSTARLWSRSSARQLTDPAVNIKVGVKYFKHLLDRYQGDAELALAAYNAGPERIDEWLKRYPLSQRILFFDMIPFKETRDYVALISRNYYWYLSLYSDFGQNQSNRNPAFQNKMTFSIFAN